MQKKYSLKKSGTFKYVYRRGSSVACKEIVLFYTKGKNTLVGLSVGKKIGGATVRNLIKRRLREAVRPYLSDMKSGNYVIVARESIKELSFNDIQDKLLYLLFKKDFINKGKK